VDTTANHHMRPGERPVATVGSTINGTYVAVELAEDGRVVAFFNSVDEVREWANHLLRSLNAAELDAVDPADVAAASIAAARRTLREHPARPGCDCPGCDAKRDRDETTQGFDAGDAA